MCGNVSMEENLNCFTSQRNYGIMLNVDWFQPFKHTNYSVGAIYVTILNLPRAERFLKKRHFSWTYF